MQSLSILVYKHKHNVTYVSKVLDQRKSNSSQIENHFNFLVQSQSRLAEFSNVCNNALSLYICRMFAVCEIPSL